MSETPRFFVHPSSVIDAGSMIGDGSAIWHFCHVMAGATIGRDTKLGQNVMVASGVVVGDRVKIQNNVSLYTGVVLEDEVFVGPSVVLTNVVNPRAAVVRRHEYQPTLVKLGATLGANSTVVCGVTVGRYAFVGAGAVVTRDVADFALVVGNPARVSGWMCACGVKLAAGASPPARAACAECRREYTGDGGVLRAAGSGASVSAEEP